MENIPTAEDLLENYRFKAGEHIGNSDYDLMCKFAVEFAKLHVEAALEAVSEKAVLKVVNTEEFRDIEEGEDLVDSYECGSDVIHISVNSILTAYPLDNIK